MKSALVLLGGDYHDFERGGELLERALGAVCDFELTQDPGRLCRLEGFQLVVLYMQLRTLSPDQESGLVSFVQRGGGIIGIHCAAASWDGSEAYKKLLGSRFMGHGPVTEFSVSIADPGHQITRRLPAFRITDEFYRLEAKSDYHVLATGSWHGQTHPLAYVRSQGAGRVFYLALGHDEGSLAHPMFQKLLKRGVQWVTHRDEKPPIASAVVGYGGAFNMGKHHADSMNGVPGFQVKAVCDLDPARRTLAEQDLPGIRTFAALQDVAADPEIQLVTVVTPHNDHYPSAMLLLQAGKHVIVEKPFCLTVAEATDMIDAAKARGLLLSTFHNRRWDDDFRTIQQIIQQGLIGEPFHLEAYFGGYSHPGYWWRSHKPVSGGAFYDWGAHFTDWALNLMPYKMETVYGLFHKRVWHDVTNEDHCQAIIRFEGGRTADIQQSSIAAVGKAKWRILGTRGGLVQETSDQIKVTSYVRGHREDLTVPLIKGGSWHSYYQNVADHLLLGEPLAVTAESARRVIAVLQLAEESARAGQPIRIPFED